jgi:hypothetical protein
LSRAVFAQTGVLDRLAQRALEIERHVAKYPGYYPEAIQHAADLRAVINAIAGGRLVPADPSADA